MTEETSSSLLSIALLVVLSIFSLSWAKKRNFFSLPEETKNWKFPISLIHVLIIFCLYLLTLIVIAPLIASVIQKIVYAKTLLNPVLSYISWVQFSHSLITFVLLFGFFLLLPQNVRSQIWGDTSSKHPFLEDGKKAILTGVLSFPIIGLSNQSIDFFLTNILHITQMPDQLAIHFLKMTFGHHLYLFLSICTIVIFAPLIEELLFRGFLQSYIRQHVGSFRAIIITSVVFALYHYAPEQGVTNITIVGSIFVVSCFFGFIYEKRRSLKASIFMHAFFNGLNVCNLYFLGGIPGGYL